MKGGSFPNGYEERVFVWQSLPIAIGTFIILFVMSSIRSMDRINCFKFIILLISLILLLLFFLNNYSINIRIKNNKILIDFGIGLVKDSIDIDSVRDIKIYESIFKKVYYTGGCLVRPYAKFLGLNVINYSVGYGSVIELFMKDDKRILISTNHPRELARYIMSVRPDLDGPCGSV